MPETAPKGRLRRLLWFCSLWLCGVLAVGALGYGILALLGL